MSCLFCSIVNKEIGAHIVYDDDAAIGILDIHPRAPGHTMIIPKVHRRTILDLADGEGGSLMNSVKTMTKILNKAFSPDGFTIGINHGESAGQLIEHLHIHIIPRWKNDGGVSIHSVVANEPKDSLETVEKKIKNTKV